MWPLKKYARKWTKKERNKDKNIVMQKSWHFFHINEMHNDASLQLPINIWSEILKGTKLIMVSKFHKPGLFFFIHPNVFPKTEELHTTMWCFEISGLIVVNAEEGWGKWEVDKKLGGSVLRPATIFESLFWSSFTVYLWDLWSGRGWGFESRKCVCWDTLGRTPVQIEARSIPLIKAFI